MTMKLSPERGLAMPISELGQRRQVVIPKQICDELGLEEGDFVEVERQGNKLVLTPKRLVEKHPEIDRRLAEAEKDIKAGQVSGPFVGPSGLPRPPGRDRVEGLLEEGNLRWGSRLQVCSQRSTRAID
jgi:AbrB family looped-hinge helix DNA binding protein